MILLIDSHPGHRDQMPFSVPRARVTLYSLFSFAEWYTAVAPGAARIIRGTALPDSKPITGGGGHSIAQTRAALEGLVYYPPSITLIEQSLHKTRRFARTAALEHLVIALSCQGCYVMQHVQMYTLLANVVMLHNNHYIKLL